MRKHSSLAWTTLPALILSIVAWIGLAGARAQCKPDDPNGYFEGMAISKQAGKLEISLNLRCAGGHYDGELTTPVGTYSVTEGSVQGGHLVLRLSAGGDVVKLDGQVNSDTLTGSFTAGDDTGTLEARRIGEARASGSSIATLDLSKAEWHEDLRFYATELPKRHINAFHHISQEQFEAEVATLDKRINQLDNDTIFVGFLRLAALIGDGHTHFEPPDDVANFPIDVRRFGDDYRVAGIGAGDIDPRALGARIVKIEQTPFAKARDLLLSLTPQDENPNLGLARIEITMTQGLYLHGLGITADRNTVHYTLAGDGGKEFTIEVRSAPMAESMKAKWTFVFQNDPLYRQNPGSVFWTEYLPASRTLYCSFRGYDGLEQKAANLMAAIEQRHPDKLVIDLRQNGGGDYTLGEKFVIVPIRDLAWINKKGHLFVLIGPYTFSAGMANAAQFRNETNAIQVGEAIGEKPNSFQEAREMRLPNSHLIARYSTQNYSFVKSGENVIRPDAEIDRDWKSYQAGRDPVLDWVVSYKGQ